MNPRLAALLALILPLAGLAALWATTERWHRQGTDWLVPVEGYDPRDLLRGHYIEFTYVWPGAAQGDLAARVGPQPPAFPFGACLRGTPPGLVRVERLESAAARADCAQFLAAGEVNFAGAPDLPRRGRLYIPQAAAGGLERQLADPARQGMVRLRLRADGTVTPLALTFVPRRSPASAPPE